MIGKHIMKAPNRTEKACNICGYRCFANCKTLVCPGAPHAPNCKGNLCSVITPLPGKRVSGVLVRDRKQADHLEEISLLTGPLDDLTLDEGVWTFWGEGTILCEWTVIQWKEQYGKLPRKGSRQMVIIELVSNGK